MLNDCKAACRRAARHPLHAKTLDEDAFLAYALNTLQAAPTAVLLDSAGPLHARSRTSYLSGNVVAVFLQFADGFRLYRDDGSAPQTLCNQTFAAWLQTFHEDGDWGRAALLPLLTYEAFNPYIAPPLPHPIWHEAQAVWLLCDHLQCYDRETQTLQLAPPREPAPFAIEAEYRAFHGRPPARGWRESEQRYGEKISQIQRHITDGNFYQANLSQRFYCTTEQDPITTYRLLRRRNPSPFMGVFRFFDHWVLSGSPERLVDKRDHLISARPIAGTQPRFVDDAAADQASIKHLHTCAKEQAEHLMLVDLIRNDLGRVARAGSVNVREFAVIETYSHVHHLVSQVEAELQPSATVWDLIESLFPGGTITGAPKISCMRTLAELEQERRGPYTGAMGYIGSDGRLDLNILIRTILQVGQAICFHAGGGIVADSQQSAEYLETRHKAAALMEALNIQV